jgi:hypothetical protein
MHISGNANSHKMKKEVTGIIIDNDIWAPTSTPSVKMLTFSPESSWTTKTRENSLDKKASMYWMAKGLNDFHELLKNLHKPEQENKIHLQRGSSKLKTQYTNKHNTNVRLREKSNPHVQKPQRDSDTVQGYVITRHSDTEPKNVKRNQTVNFNRNDTRPNIGTRIRDRMLKRKHEDAKKSKQHTKVNTNLNEKLNSSPQKENMVYRIEERNRSKYSKSTAKTRVGIPVVNSILKTVLTSEDSKFTGKSISDADKTTASNVHSETQEHQKQNSERDRSTFNDNILLGRRVRPIFTLSGTADNNVFSGGKSFQLSAIDSNKGHFSDHGLGQNKIVHERPQIASNLYSPSNEFYVENGVNSISYKEHFKKLMNPRSGIPKAPYSFDGSKIYSTGTSGPLFLSHDNAYQKPAPTQYPVPVSQSRESKRPFYLTDPNYDSLIPFIPESSTQPNMYNTEKLTTRHYSTFPPNFLEMLGISLEEPITPHSRNLKSSPYLTLTQNAEEYHHQETNVHFFRQAPYLPSTWIHQASYKQQLPPQHYTQRLPPQQYTQPLPPQQFRQKPKEVEISFTGKLNCPHSSC